MSEPGDFTLRDRGPWVILAAVLAFLGIKALPSSAPAPPAEDKREKAQVTGAGAPVLAAGGRDFYKPLADFRNADQKAMADGPWDGFPEVKGWDLRCLLAT